MGLAKRSETQRYTYADYLGWDDSQRWELIDGTAYAMAPAPAIVHQDIAGGIYAQVLQGLHGKSCRVFVAPVDVRLPKPGQNEQRSDTVVQPDVLAVCDSAKIGERGIVGAPDWVVEVLSPSTASHDNILKRRIYEQAGVREFWLVHPGDRILQIYRLENGVYGKPDALTFEGSTSVGVLPDVAIDWERIVPLLPPLQP